jgi:hypothetical protein
MHADVPSLLCLSRELLGASHSICSDQIRQSSMSHKSTSCHSWKPYIQAFKPYNPNPAQLPLCDCRSPRQTCSH